MVEESTARSRLEGVGSRNESNSGRPGFSLRKKSQVPGRPGPTWEALPSVPRGERTWLSGKSTGGSGGVTFHLPDRKEKVFLFYSRVHALQGWKMVRKLGGKEFFLEIFKNFSVRNRFIR